MFWFDLRNNWYSGDVVWNLSDPDLSNSTNLNYNETIFVAIESNYSRGSKQPELTASISSFIDRVTDFFEIRPLEIYSLKQKPAKNHYFSGLWKSSNFQNLYK
ncbi:MAG: hypothetical protein KAT77_04240 [Nanoarchaeota archaeon]|nr:hypothetical protein [Nanoarchaeota archaeon]